jgi:hypothetical protein
MSRLVERSRQEALNIVVRADLVPRASWAQERCCRAARGRTSPPHEVESSILMFEPASEGSTGDWVTARTREVERLTE